MNCPFKIFLLTCAALQIAGCERDFIPPEVKGASKMVVNCRLDNERYIKVYATESFTPYAGANLKPVPDAMVELYKNDYLLQILPFVFTDSAKTFGSYQYPHYPAPGDRYAVTIRHAKYGVITARDALPPLAEVPSYSLVHYGDSSTSFRSQFHFQFRDDGLTDDYYRINVWQWGKQMRYDYSVNDTVIEDYGYSSRVEIASPLYDTVRDFGTYILFSDKGFNGQTKQIDMQFNSASLENVTDGELTVELSHVSKAHYEYFKSMELFKNNLNSDNFVTVFTNIENGYGIFMGEAINNMTIKVK